MRKVRKLVSPWRMPDARAADPGWYRNFEYGGVESDRVGNTDHDGDGAAVAVGHLPDKNDLPRPGRLHLTVEPNFGRLADGDLLHLNRRQLAADVELAQVHDFSPNQSARPSHCARADVQPGDLTVDGSGHRIQLQLALGEGKLGFWN